ncbi:hypothetical protein KR084_000006 [Drosophila pseudotakahashii]|nr:hypothetical protein KR084_000006 [Drosophila pseudotakahashii]
MKQSIQLKITLKDLFDFEEDSSDSEWSLDSSDEFDSSSDGDSSGESDSSNEPHSSSDSDSIGESDSSINSDSELDSNVDARGVEPAPLVNDVNGGDREGGPPAAKRMKR